MTASLRLPLAPPPAAVAPSSGASLSDLLTDLQIAGLRWGDSPGLSRAGGAGPSDHKAVRVQGQTLMVPIFTHASSASPYVVKEEHGRPVLFREAARIGEVSFPRAPRFYSGRTADGIPYFKLATLHSHDVLATTVMQNCTRFGDRATSCQFCAIGQSLTAKRTIARKTPGQLAEVAAAAVQLDGVSQMILTTGTPPTPDRGAALLADSAAAIAAATDIAIQAQCEPPDDLIWLERLRAAGVKTLGMHLEAVTESVRRRIMPGKAEVSVATYLKAFQRAVATFGRGEVTTYILAGLGDTHAAIVSMADRLSRMGVYPFVVPFVPIVGTPLERHAPPTSDFMKKLLDDVARVVAKNDLSSQDASAGCGRCGACSTLRSRETGKLAQRSRLPSTQSRGTEREHA